ncbi:trypsin-3-like [Anticarsia gemmatalis]|uniref:trypsin-3-like n=1 Tax=Anticarsia gemmatalis TaxID=129554 RepID=UPI003F765BEC
MLSDIIKCVIIVGAVASLASPVEKDTFVATTSTDKDSIYGGNNASIKDFPYQVSIYIVDNVDGDLFYCGGSIISQNYILTAAHCIHRLQPPDLVVQVGSAHLKTGTVIKLVELIAHPDYNSKTIDNDVALMKTATPIEFNDIIQPIKLPGEDGSLEEGSILTLSGWGMTETSDGSDTLLAVKVPVVSDANCRKLLQNPITKSMFCAGGLDTSTKGPCVGDTGSPAVLDGVQYGIVSWGKYCHLPNYPYVYVKILEPSIRSFINKHAGV